jgi:magnesium chelatase family protein
MLVAAMNPCPCGYFGDTHRTCRCSQRQVVAYRNRISGPLLDRIDIQIEVAPVSCDALCDLPPGESSEEIRRRVMRARAVQRQRFADCAGASCNADMSARMLSEFCRLDGDAQKFMRGQLQALDLSARAYTRILKVARTVADLAGHAEIAWEDISEASGYRALDRQFWG